MTDELQSGMTREILVVVVTVLPVFFLAVIIDMSRYPILRTRGWTIAWLVASYANLLLISVLELLLITRLSGSDEQIARLPVWTVFITLGPVILLTIVGATKTSLEREMRERKAESRRRLGTFDRTGKIRLRPRMRAARQLRTPRARATKQSSFMANLFRRG